MLSFANTHIYMCECGYVWPLRCMCGWEAGTGYFLVSPTLCSCQLVSLGAWRPYAPSHQSSLLLPPSLCVWRFWKDTKQVAPAPLWGFGCCLPLREAAGAWKSQPQPTEAPKSGEGRERETVLVVKKKKKRKEIAWFKKRTTASTIQKVRLKQPVQINKELCKDEEWRRKYNEANKG